LNARRWQVYAGRSLFVVLILIGMTIVWVQRDHLVSRPAAKPSTYNQIAKIGEWFYYAMAGIQISLVMLAAPAAAAGSICMDRARGTLAHVMVTDLSDIEIILGKLGARLAPIAGLIACGVPVACLSALLGGIEFESIAGVFIVSLSLAVFACTLALCISVWAAKTHEVLMAVYMILGLWLMALPIWEGLSSSGSLTAPPAWFQKSNPYVLVFAPYYKPGFAGITDVAVFACAVLILSAALALISIARIRSVVTQQSGRPRNKVDRRSLVLKRLFPSWPSPSLDGNPVLWREWSRSRPSKLARRLWAILLLLIWMSMAWGTYEAVTDGESSMSNGFSFGFLLLFLFGMLMLSATAPTAMAEERVLGSLDALLATPLATRSILVGKWWGMYRRVLLLVLVPLYAGFFMAATEPDIPVWAGRLPIPRPLIPLGISDRLIAPTLSLVDFFASGALVVSWGLLLAIWVRRLGRAVTLSVIVFFLLGFGWPCLVELVLSPMFMKPEVNWYEQDHVMQECLLAFSPFVGPMTAISSLQQIEIRGRGPLWLGIGAVIVVKSTLAGFMFWLALKTFDGCLGRIKESRVIAGPEKSAVRRDLVPHLSLKG
jgi:ABC-type transport system involved in multi-copper enzyme maturation permease subunit